MSKTTSRTLYILGVALLLNACAQMRAPTGGEKDEIAPAVLSANPSNLSTDFSGQRIEIEFDEYVNLTDVSEQVIISPPPATDPEITLKGYRKVIVEFFDPLLENTTYTINFGESIKDYNEGNPLTENLFLFSTGPLIDSLELKGTVRFAKNDGPCAGCIVLLHESGEDSLIYFQKPMYMSRSQEDGQFLLPHLREGSFELYALEDENRNLKYDPGEHIALFGAGVSPLTADSIGHDLKLFQEEEEELYLTSVEYGPYRQSIRLVASKYWSDFDLKPIANSPEPLYVMKFDRKDSLEIWYAPYEEIESVQLEVSSSEMVLDTIEMRVDKRKTDYDALSAQASKLSNAKDSLLLHFIRPVKLIDLEKISLMQDSIAHDFEVLILDEENILVKSDWEWGVSYDLTLYPSSVQPLFGNSTDTLSFSIKCPKEDELGSLIVIVNDSSMVNRRMYVVPDGATDIEKSLQRHIDRMGDFRFDYLEAGDYRIFVLQDENGNGVWDTGSVIPSRQPDQMIERTEPIQLKGNWEVEVIID